MDPRNRSDPDGVIAALADAQYSVVARRQLLAHGVAPDAIRTRVRSGLLLKLHRGVYALGHRRLTQDGFWLAAVLAAGDEAVLSHRDAAVLHGLGRWSSGPVEVTSGGEVRSTRFVRVYARHVLAPDDVTVVASIPVTTVARTIVDLASVVTRERLASALTAAEQANALDVGAILAARDRVLHRRGRGDANLRAALTEHAARGAQLTREELERRLRRLVRIHRPGRPLLNASVAGDEVDAYWPKARLIVEADGWRWHRDRAAFERDREKTNRLQLAGYVVLRFTHDAIVRRPDQVATAVRRALTAATTR